VKTLLYLHGLASSPKGRKRAILESRFAGEDVRVVAPDLNAPSFRELDFNAMRRRAAEAAAECHPDVVIGSSLGALVALAIAREPGAEPAPVVLVAPALAFAERWASKLPPGDPLMLFHHGEGRDLPIHRRFFLDMANVAVDADPPPVPVSVVMGTNDESVPFAQVLEAWRAWEASGRLVKGSRFHAVEGGDHGLTEYGAEIEAAVRERL
jgi:pimeloyl-ACP methyl ester carboxylesterase